MEIISLIELLRTGKFGNIKLTDSKGHVIKELGEPEGLSNPDIYDAIFFGWFEFVFDEEGKLNSILNDHILTDDQSIRNDLYFENEFFRFESWFKLDKNQITYEKVTKQLKTEGIVFRVLDHNEYIEILMVENHSSLCFDIFPENVKLLSVISIYEKRKQ